MRQRIHAIAARLVLELWRVRTVVGIGVSADSLRAIAVRRGRARWCVEIERSLDASLSEQVERLLQSSPASGQRPHPPVMLAVPPRHSQVKNLQNLPPAADRLLEAVIRESIARFFRKNGVPLAIGGVERATNGVWAAAYEIPFLTEVAEGCTRVGLRLHAACPSVIAAARSSPETALRWRDGGDDYEVLKAADGTLLRVRVCPQSNIRLSAENSPRVDDGLEPLASDAWRFADAFGAANYARCEAIALRSSKVAVLQRAHRRRIAAAAIICLIAWSVVAVLRVVSLRNEASTMRSELARMSSARHEYGTAVAELARATRQLDALAGFDAQRGHITTMLAELAAALPPGSAITALHVDSASGTMVAIAPRASSLVDAFERVPSIASVEILGPIGRDALPTNATSASSSAVASWRDVERVTLRFRLVHRRKAR